MKISELELLAPLSGLLVSLDKVPDPVFSQKLVGDGIGIDPTSSVLVAPCAGTVSQLHAAKHALTITAENGVQILLHIGIDTVNLKGRGFKTNVKLGDSVKVGQPLIEFDPDLLAREARSLVSVMIIAEAPTHRLSATGAPTVVAAVDRILTLKLDEAQSATPNAAPKTTTGASAESAPITITLPTGLHARPAALVAARAKPFAANLELVVGEKTANAKSMVGILGLEIQKGSVVKFRGQGSDAEAAVNALAKYLSELKEAAPAPAPVATTPASRSSGSAQVLTGVIASPGLALGRVYQLRSDTFEIPEKADDPRAEKTKLETNLRRADEELESLKSKVTAGSDVSQSAIFAAHQELLQDPDLLSRAFQSIDEGKSAAWAWNETTTNHAARLAKLNNELMANRANDLQDVGRRVLRLILGAQSKGPADSKSNGSAPQFQGDTILIAENLTPSDTVQLDRSKILGFCTTTGSATSHVAILARSLGIPALAAVEARALELANGTEVLIDGVRGELRLNPSAEEKTRVQQQQTQLTAKRTEALKHAFKSAQTIDGTVIEVAANIGGIADAENAVEMGCDGVGLLRSEFLFLERATAPSEEEQFEVYQRVADILGSRPLTVRTLDVGGDKPLRYLPLPAEENPFLGVRGLRVGLLKPDLLREQLRALVRVKSHGTLNIMFPMVASIEEYREARKMLEDEKKKLNITREIKVGIMIEVPSAALTAEVFAPEVDFFSIGTNDLTQYTLAMDRGHKDLASRVDALHPGVLRLIQITVAAAKAHGKWVGVCGGIASDPQAAAVLLGLGVDELSVSAPSIPLVKARVREIDLAQAKTLGERAVRAQNAAAVRALIAKPTPTPERPHDLTR